MKKLHQALLLIAIYALALGIRIFWLSQKEGLHVDEGLTIAITCYNDYITSVNYRYGKRFSGKEVKEASLVSDASLKDALADIHRLWKDNRDPPHTNLYYSFFRLSLIGLKTTDIAPVVLRGGILNLLFFTVSFLYFFLLMRLLFAKSKLLQYAATFCAFLSTAAISNTLFLRPYQIQEMFFIVFCYYFVLSLGWKKKIIHEGKISINVTLQTALMSIITAFTLLTGYYAIIFIGLFGLYAIYLQCRNKTFTDIPYYFVVLGLGLFFAGILYPKYFTGFSSYRGKEVINTISGNVTENILSSIKSAGTLLQKHFFSYSVIVVCVLCLAYIIILLFREQKLRIKKNDFAYSAKPAWYIFAASILFLFIVLTIAPYKILRYGMPVFPFFVILPAMLIDSIGTRSRKIAACAMLLLCGCFAYNVTRESKIENIFRGKPNEYVFAQDKDTPVYIFNDSWSLWKYANLIPYLHDEQTYYFINWRDYLQRASFPLPEAENYSAIYLITEYLPESPQLDLLIMRNLQTIQGAPLRGTTVNEFEINTGEPESWHPYFKGRKMILVN